MNLLDSHLKMVESCSLHNVIGQPEGPVNVRLYIDKRFVYGWGGRETKFQYFLTAKTLYQSICRYPSSFFCD